ncbi:MAG: 2-phospho-L-lactate guanylyltransferase [Halobacteriota archaeon]|nr:2-phospho-L-lactate guanylyltransferase [Halobacteriota archaeon]
MMTIVPFKGTDAKSRLSPLLSESERGAFARCMLRDVLGVLEDSDAKEVVVLTKTLEAGLEDLNLFINEKDLNEAINEILFRMNEPLLIVMPDLPLIEKRHINEILDREEDVVIAPGRRGGTNIVFLKRPKEFVVDYHGASFLDHIIIAKERKLSVSVYDSFFISSDIDEVDDLMELLIHGDGSSARYLREINIKISIDDGEVNIKRED